MNVGWQVRLTQTRPYTHMVTWGHVHNKLSTYLELTWHYFFQPRYLAATPKNFEDTTTSTSDSVSLFSRNLYCIFLGIVLSVIRVILDIDTSNKQFTIPYHGGVDIKMNINWIHTISWKSVLASWPVKHVTMTSSNGNIFRVTGPLCREFTGHRWIPLTNASYAELWCFFYLWLSKRLS